MTMNLPWYIHVLGYLLSFALVFIATVTLGNVDYSVSSYIKKTYTKIRGNIYPVEVELSFYGWNARQWGLGSYKGPSNNFDSFKTLYMVGPFLYSREVFFKENNAR